MSAAPIAFAAQRPIDALAGTGAWPVAWIAACEGGPEAGAVAARLGCPVFSLEDRERVRRTWSNATVPEALAAALRERTLAPGAPVLPYAASTGLDAVLAGRGAAILAPPGALKERLDDRAGTRLALARLGVEVPAWHSATAPLGPAGRELPLVVQRRGGSAGLGTWIARSVRELAAIQVAAGEPLLLSRYVPGDVCNVHAVASARGIEVAAPSVQAAGVPELVPGETHYCGNDFGLARRLHPQALAAIRRGAEAIGRWLVAEGYAGVFGVDFVVDGARAVALEVNPRLQGSTWLLAELERAAGRATIGDRHVAASIGAAGPAEPPAADLDGAMVVLHHLGDAPLPAGSAVAPGVHHVDAAGRLEWRRPGLSPADCRTRDELVIGGLAASGTVVEPGAVVARISSPASLLESSGSLSAAGRRAIAAVLAAGLRPG